MFKFSTGLRIYVLLVHSHIMSGSAFTSRRGGGIACRNIPLLTVPTHPAL